MHTYVVMLLTVALTSLLLRLVTVSVAAQFNDSGSMLVAQRERGHDVQLDCNMATLRVLREQNPQPRLSS